MSQDELPTLTDKTLAPLSRQQRRHRMRQRQKAASRKPQKFSRRRPEPLAQYYPLALEMLRTGPKATPPKMRAVRKMARYLMASPLHSFTRRHQRGSWRSWDRDIGREQVQAIIDSERNSQ